MTKTINLHYNIHLQAVQPGDVKMEQDVENGNLYSTSNGYNNGGNKEITSNFKPFQSLVNSTEASQINMEMIRKRLAERFLNQVVYN